MLVNTEAKRSALIEAMTANLAQLDALGADIAAAHLQAAIDALRRYSGMEQDPSDLD